jgi:hypothetical protein
MENLCRLTIDNTNTVFWRAIAIVITTIGATAFTSVNSPIDVNVHNQPRGVYDFLIPLKENLVPIECAELQRRQIEDEDLAYDRQYLLQERTLALKRNDDSLLQSINSELQLVQRKQSVNLMAMRVLSSIPVHVEFPLSPSSDRVLFLLGRSQFGRWGKGTITYLDYSSELETFVNFDSNICNNCVHCVFCPVLDPV